jgi:methylated-DNA-[protein]-cysteine S-methyltransferase
MNQLQKRLKQQENVFWSKFIYEDWSLYLAATEKGLCCITLPHDSADQLQKWVNQHFPGATFIENEQKLAVYQEQLQEYFAGNRRTFTIPLDMRGTDFQVAVWKALLEIPYGQLKSYSEIAEAIHRPKAVRAVGAANGANPIPFVVPCHRVIGKNRTLTGYRGGLQVKAKLLQVEGQAEYVSIGHNRFQF